MHNLNNRVYHNFKFVIPLLKKGFDLDITSKIGTLTKYIELRHDIVHRNGRNKDNVTNQISIADIENLMNETEILVNYMEKQFSQIKNKE